MVEPESRPLGGGSKQEFFFEQAGGGGGEGANRNFAVLQVTKPEFHFLEERLKQELHFAPNDQTAVKFKDEQTGILKCLK